MAYVNGIDVSRWNDINATPQKINWSMARDAGVIFAFIRATAATTTDEDWTYNWRESKGVIPFRGAYAFYDFRQSAYSQANYFVGIMDGNWGELPPVIDVEQPYQWDAEKKAMVPVPFPPSTDWRNSVTKWLNIVEKACGRKPIIYTNPNCIKYGLKLFSDSPLVAYPLWIAAYQKVPPNPYPWKRWDFWQWGTPSVGKQYGMESEEVDANYFNGTIEELGVFCGTIAPPTAQLTDKEKLDKLWEAHPELHKK